MTSPGPSLAFAGYAIVSADGFIADDDGHMPDSLKFEADWAYFQAALDRADITLIGRLTHEAAPNVKKAPTSYLLKPYRRYGPGR